jgi:deoxyribodipyrimidine photo-lyase
MFHRAVELVDRVVGVGVGYRLMSVLDVPQIRLREVNDAPLHPTRPFVLYWMIAARRTRANFALQHAVRWALDLKRPLLVFEALRCGYRWASDRHHTFVLEGMADNATAFAQHRVTYLPYVEPRVDEGKGLLEALAQHAAVVVTDEFPAFFLPRMVAAAGARLDVRLEAIDSNGLLPLRSADRAFPTAYSFRSFLRKHLPEHLDYVPLEDPLADAALAGPAIVPPEIEARWNTAATKVLLRTDLDLVKGVATLPIDHRVPAVVQTRGGQVAGHHALFSFMTRRLDHYRLHRNEPERDATSGFSPYLHFGHLSTHAIFSSLMTRERWTTRKIRTGAGGKRDGWWGASANAEAFLDELITWRELGFNMCAHRPGDYDRYESLPDWAQATLATHASDPRPTLYTIEQLEASHTHDTLWNAAQTQLVREGRIHNYLRMLWGKKILEWTPGPREALDVMIHLNNKFALDGRDPNAYSGIFWVLGRYDRPWGPERPIFGTIRYMSSQNTARKVPVREYVKRYSLPA